MGAINFGRNQLLYFKTPRPRHYPEDARITKAEFIQLCYFLWYMPCFESNDVSLEVLQQVEQTEKNL